MTTVLLVGKGEPERGGIPSFLSLLLASSLAEEHDLRFLNLAGGPPRGGRLSGSNLARTVRDTWRVWRAARDVDVVHIHSAGAPAVTMVRAGLLAAAGRVRGARVILHAHGGRVQLWLTTDARRRLCRAALSAAQTVVAVAEGSESALRRARVRADVVLVDNGVDVGAFGHIADVPRDGCRVLYVGLLSERKGVLDLIAASDLLADRGIEHQVVLVGGTPDEGAAAAAAPVAAAEARPGRVVLAGSRDHGEMPGVYAGADVFCLASWWEAMPLSVLEAMAAGIPVVATDVGDVRRVVDAETGRLVPSRSPEALADALQELLLDKSLAHRLGRAGRERVTARFDGRRTVAAIGKLYDPQPDSAR